jgi:thiol-disulfide isomerase/thioredoxin
MPPRVQKEYSVQVRDNEAWSSITLQEGRKLNIVDAYLPWCGPCLAIQNMIKNLVLKIEDWENRVQFYKADIEQVPMLAALQSSSQPKFLFFLVTGK